MSAALTARRRLDTPLVPMAVTVVLSIGFVLLRWRQAAGRNLGRFIVIGSKYSNRSALPKGIPNVVGNGYDGQFYYRLALDPFNLSRAAYGIRLDSISRVERMAYPFLAWALAFGQHDRIPLTLVIVNVVAAGVLGFAGAMLAKTVGRHAAWGLVFPLYWGYLWTLGRDLTELTTAALVMLGLVALLRARPWWAGVAFLGAVLSKETAVLVVGMLALTSVWMRVRRSSPAGPADSQHGLTWQPADVAYAIPLIGFALWQVVLFIATSRVPIYKSGGENLGVPVLGLVRGFTHYATLFPSTASYLWFGELCLIIVLIIGAARWRTTVPPQIRVLWVVTIILGLCTATGIWLGDVGFRSLDDIYLLCWIVLLYQRARIWPLAAACAGAWVVVAVELIRYI